MKALVYEEYAPDDNYERILKLKEISEPRPKSNEVVFKVKATGLNYDDIWGMRGKPIQIPMPHISGTDAAGEVIAVGEDVTTIKVGDRIVSHGNISCRVCNACTDGREYDCRERKVWGFQTGPLWGGYCEITHLPEVNVARIPDNISYEEAAAASMALTTSWHMLVGRAKIKPGQTILIMGGGSGMGTFGIQIAKLFDCDVITTASPDKLDRCLKIGADYAIDHRKENWHKEVFTITKELGKKKNQSPGVDIIFEHIGGSHWNKELTLLKYGATLVTTGATTGYDVKSDLRHIFFKGTNILGSTQGTKAELEESIYWMSKGKIKSIIDSVYTFENAAEAHKKMLKGNIFGKILMKPD
ncbi:MAG TPA: zinc-binding dehydrogenase [Nitrosopumilaceae archaeon]|nr:zinc-binding dehydrogenase [Nitrosopumilaceae archaeon]